MCLCEMSFAQKGQLKRHVKVIHQQIRPFECDQCKKTFTKKNHLKGHVKAVHQKIRPFECVQCKKTFAQKQPDLAASFVSSETQTSDFAS